jgi:hypothetical protein
MRRALVILTAVGALCALTASSASASTRCSGDARFATRGGYAVHLSRYRSLAAHEHSEGGAQMSCSSVRYAMRFVRRRIAQQYGIPHVPRHVFDGYVTWDIYRAGHYGWEAVEYDSGTGFRFRASYVDGEGWDD